MVTIGLLRPSVQTLLVLNGDWVVDQEHCSLLRIAKRVKEVISREYDLALKLFGTRASQAQIERGITEI